MIPSFFYQTIVTIVQTSIHSWWNRLDLPAICYVESPFVGPFVKKATLYTGDVSRVWTQEIIPVEDFFMRCHNILLPVLQMIVSYFFQLLSSPDAVAVFRNMTELFFPRVMIHNWKLPLRGTAKRRDPTLVKSQPRFLARCCHSWGEGIRHWQRRKLMCVTLEGMEQYSIEVRLDIHCSDFFRYIFSIIIRYPFLLSDLH